MYYPIIDKLKELMADITSVKEKEPLIIEGTFTSQTKGTWTGNYSDLVAAFNNKKPIYFSLATPTGTFLVPVIEVTTSNANSCLFSVANSQGQGVLYNDNTFKLMVVQ